MLLTKAFRFGYGLLLIFLIILVAMKIDFIFRPIFLLVQTLFFPFLIAGVLYYLFRPLVNYLELKSIPRILSILLIYVLFGLLLILLISLGGPLLKEQVKNFADSTPQLMEAIQDKVAELQQSKWNSHLRQSDSVDVEKASDAIAKSVSASLATIGTNVMNIIGVLASIVMVFATVPFILYYMLKEGEKAPRHILRFLPAKQQKNGRKILVDLDEALSSYIQGQVLVSFCIGVMLFIGYLIIDLDYSLLLAIFSMLTNVIPFIGPILAITPALIIACIDSPIMAVKVLIVMIIVQQIEGHIISPQVMGRKLEIHPLTIISLLLAAGRIGGVLGLIIAVPVYAVIKVIAHHSYRLWKLRKEKSIEDKIINGGNNDETKSYNDAIF
jgi:predicted PurR-regulated permease PerM